MLNSYQFSTKEDTPSSHPKASQPTPLIKTTKRDHSSCLRKSKEEVKFVREILDTTFWDKDEGNVRSGSSRS
jgi:hypothetical protein